MLKKYLFLLIGLALSGCQSSSVSQRPSLTADNSVGSTIPSGVNLIEYTQPQDNMFRVGMLLPLTGSAAKYGQGLKNAALLASDDMKADNLILQFYDTQSTDSGARIAVENALSQNAKLIVGPLLSSSVQAIENETTSAGVPVVAFSTNSEVFKPDVYSLGLLVNEQVDDIISYAASKGRSRFALLIPDDDSGISIAKAAASSAIKNNVSLVRIAFYTPNTTDFTEAVKGLTDYDTRSARLQKVKRALQKQAGQGDASASQALKRLERTQALGDVDFDAVIIPESGAKLKSALAMFGYYDVYSPKVRFLGTTVWESTDLSRETMAIGSWFPAMPKAHSAYFSSKYAETFGEKPAAIYSLAYDAVALAASLAKKNPEDLTSYITSPEGYAGINGIFRILPNGLNEHSLDIYEVSENGNVVVKNAAKSFSSDLSPDEAPLSAFDNVPAPIITGKNSEAAQFAIYGRILPSHQQMSDQANEMDIIRKALKERNVVLP